MPVSPTDDVVEPKPGETTEATATDVKSESSPEKDAPAPTMLDAVKSALNKTPRGEVSPTSDEPVDKAKAADPVKDPDVDPDELTSEETSQLSARTQKRLKKLASEVKAKDGEISNLSSRASQYDQIEQYVTRSGLTEKDLGSILEIGALLVNDPRSARARLMPILTELDRVLGETLPNELQARVDQGYLTEDDAKALARANANAAIATRRADEVAQQQQAAEARRSTEQLVSTTLSSVETWEANKAKGDPDWHEKQAEVSSAVKLAILERSQAEGRPWFPNQKEAIELSETALKAVNDKFARFRPKPKPMSPPVTGGASPHTITAPQSMLDVVKMNSGSR